MVFFFLRRFLGACGVARALLSLWFGSRVIGCEVRDFF